MNLSGSIITLFIGLLGFFLIILRNNIKISVGDFLLLIIPLIILLPPIRIGSSLPAIRFEEILFYSVFSTIIIVELIKDKIYINNNFIYILLLMLFSMTISTIYAVVFLNTQFSYRNCFEFIKVIKFILIIMVLSNIKYNDKFIGQIITIIMISITCSAFVGILQHFNVFDINNIITPLFTISHLKNIDMRIIGTMSNPNDFGILLTIGMILTLSHIIIAEKKKIIFMLAAIVMFIAIIFTVSRTALLSLIIATIVIIIYSYKRLAIPKKYMIYIIMVLGFIGLIVLKFAAEYFITRMSSGIDVENDYSMLIRLSRWHEGLTIWSKSPIFGWGAAKGIQTTIVDNEYILTLRRYGIFGLVIYLLFYLMPYMELNKINYSKLSENIKVFTISMKAIIVILLVNNITGATFSNIQLMDLWIIIISIFYSINFSIIRCIQNAEYSK